MSRPNKLTANKILRIARAIEELKESLVMQQAGEDTVAFHIEALDEHGCTLAECTIREDYALHAVSMAIKTNYDYILEELNQEGIELDT